MKRKYPEVYVCEDFLSSISQIEEGYIRDRHIYKRTLPISKIISGGQTGADRGGLEGAFDLGLETGGTAAPGFYTSKGKDYTLKTKFGLEEIILSNVTHVSMSLGYVMRSKHNVDNSDGTVVFRDHQSVGSDKTIGYCLTGKWKYYSKGDINRPTRYKPVLIVSDLQSIDEMQRLRNFLLEFDIKILNVAGNREFMSKDESFCGKVKDFIIKSLRGYL